MQKSLINVITRNENTRKLFGYLMNYIDPLDISGTCFFDSKVYICDIETITNIEIMGFWVRKNADTDKNLKKLNNYIYSKIKKYLKLRFNDDIRLKNSVLKYEEI